MTYLPLRSLLVQLLLCLVKFLIQMIILVACLSPPPLLQCPINYLHSSFLMIISTFDLWRFTLLHHLLFKILDRKCLRLEAITHQRYILSIEEH
jgi:hypothetical protein